MNTTYPREIEFESPLRHLTENSLAYDFIKKVTDETHMYQPAENIIEIFYPEELVEDIHIVNVDNYFFRLDFKYKKHGYSLFECFFPKCGYNRENFFNNKRFYNCQRTEEPEKVTLKFPELEN